MILLYYPCQIQWYFWYGPYFPHSWRLLIWSWKFLWPRPDWLPSVLYVLKLIQPLWLVVLSRHGVTVFGCLNCSVFSTCNNLAVQAWGYTFGVPLGDIVLRITWCVRDDEETADFYSYALKKMRDHIHFIIMDFLKFDLLIENWWLW